jgi:PIF1-like helicase
MNEGKGWTAEADVVLWNQRYESTFALATKFNRTEGSIKSRLKHLNNPEHAAYIRLRGGGLQSPLPAPAFATIAPAPASQMRRQSFAPPPTAALVRPAYLSALGSPSVAALPSSTSRIKPASLLASLPVAPANMQLATFSPGIGIGEARPTISEKQALIRYGIQASQLEEKVAQGQISFEMKSMYGNKYRQFRTAQLDAIFSPIGLAEVEEGSPEKRLRIELDASLSLWQSTSIGPTAFVSSPSSASSASTFSAGDGVRSIDDDSSLNTMQRVVADAVIKSKTNAFITGPAGVGKSFLLKFIVQEMERLYGRDSIAITAATGVAATHIGGTTIHSFSGIGLGLGRAETLAEKTMKNSTSVARWRRTKVLIIDEISMIDSVLFEKIDHVARACRSTTHMPFGGVQLIIFGDFLQLPPVQLNRFGKDGFTTTPPCISFSARLPRYRRHHHHHHRSCPLTFEINTLL